MYSDVIATFETVDLYRDLRTFIRSFDEMIKVPLELKDVNENEELLSRGYSASCQFGTI
jgi:hypothetical protein